MVNRRMVNRSITSLRSRRRQTTVSHSRAGFNTDSRNPCRTASRSNTDNRNLMDSLSRRCRSMVSRGRCRTVSPPCPSPPRLNRRFHSLRCHNMPNRNNTVSRNRQCPATFLPSKPAPRPKISRRSPLIHNLAIPRHIDIAKGGTDRYWSVPPFAMSDDSSVDYREGNLTGCRPDRSGRRCRPGSHPG